MFGSTGGLYAAMPYLRCPQCNRVAHVVVWHVGADCCRACGRPLVRLRERFRDKGKAAPPMQERHLRPAPGPAGRADPGCS